MSRLKLGGGPSFACLGGTRGGTRCDGSSLVWRRLAFQIARFVILCVLAFAWSGLETARAQQADIAIYKRAVDYCRGVTKRPMALDLDGRVLCFDGDIWPGSDFSPASGLESGGLFVVRSRGGDAFLAMYMANFVRDRRATVVVYDYCFSACANYLLVASDETFVLGGTLVAWHHTSLPLCAILKNAKDGGPKRLEKDACSEVSERYQTGHREYEERTKEFYASRVVDPLFEHPPESSSIRRRLRNMFEGNGAYPDVMWTWNPRYLTRTFKAKIVYEAYPSSQIEVDAQLSMLGFRYRILHDP